MSEASDDVLVLNIVASDPWEFVGPDGSNVFRAVTASRRTGAHSDEYPWVVDFGDRLGSARFFALRLPEVAEAVLRSGGTVDCSLVSLSDEQQDPWEWRGGLAARCTARLA